MRSLMEMAEYWWEEPERFAHYNYHNQAGNMPADIEITLN